MLIVAGKTRQTVCWSYGAAERTDRHVRAAEHTTMEAFRSTIAKWSKKIKNHITEMSGNWIHLIEIQEREDLTWVIMQRRSKGMGAAVHPSKSKNMKDG